MTRLFQMFTLVLAAGCGFRTTLGQPDGSQLTISCENDGVCPEGFLCVATVGRCFPQTFVRTRPQVSQASVSPRRVRRRDTLTVEFEVDQPLAQAPQVIGPWGRGEASQVSGLRYRFDYYVGDAALEGTHLLDVAVVSAAGLESRSPVGSAIFDFTPPQLKRLQVRAPTLTAPGVVDLRPGVSLSMLVEFSEEVASAKLVSAGCGGLDTSLLSSGFGGEFFWSAPAALAECQGVMTISSVTDLAGNSVDLDTGLVLHLDGLSPVLEQVEVQRFDGGPATAFSAQAGFNELQVVSSFRGASRVNFYLGSDELACSNQCTVNNDILRCRCRAAVTGDGGVKTVLLSVRAFDAAGNTSERSVPLVFDFEPPALGYSDVSIASTPWLQAPAAVALDSGIRLTLSANETLSAAALVVRTGLGPQEWPMVVGQPSTRDASGIALLQRLSGSAATVSARLVDALGNSVEAPLRSFPILNRPIPVLVPQQVWFLRRPWGAPPQIGLRVEGLDAGGVVVGLAGANRLDGELMRVPLDGGWAEAYVPSFDRRSLHVAVVDAAGRASPLVETTQVELEAGFERKRTAADSQVPHTFAEQREFEYRLPSEGDAVFDNYSRLSDSGVETSGAGRWSALPFDSVERRIYGHAAVYDSHRRRTIVVGGRDSRAALVPSPVEWDGVSWQAHEGRVVTPRADMGLAYDTSRRRTVVFGGQNERYLSDTWEFDGVRWSMRNPKHAPPARSYASMIYDPASKRVVLFGGIAASGYTLNDVWLWDGFDWQEMVVGGTQPPSRGLAAAVFDPVDRSLVFVGGQTRPVGGAISTLDDCWRLKQGWQRCPALPEPSLYSVMASVDGSLIFVRGYANPLVWRLSPGAASWSPVMQLGAVLGSNVQQVGASDENGMFQLMWGGVTGDTLGLSSFDAGWVVQRSSVSSPGLQSLATSAVDPTRDGGGVLFHYYASSRDLWHWSGRQWERSALLTDGPSLRGLSGLVTDSVAGRVLLVGGYDYSRSSRLGDLWEWRGGGWSNLDAGFVPRANPTLAVRADGVLVVHGDSQPAIEYGAAGWRSSPEWGPYQGQAGGLLVAAGQRLVLSHQSLTGIWDGQWTTATAATPARTNQRGTYDSRRQRVVVFGGDSSGGLTNTVTEFDGTNWRDVTPSRAGPTVRAGGGFTYLREADHIVLHGGSTTDPLTWLYKVNSSGQPGQLATFRLSELGEGTSVSSLEVVWPGRPGGTGSLQLYEAGSFVEVVPLGPLSVAPLRWSTSDRARLERIFDDEQQVTFALLGPANGTGAASMASSAPRLRVRFLQLPP